MRQQQLNLLADRNSFKVEELQLGSSLGGDRWGPVLSQFRLVRYEKRYHQATAWLWHRLYGHSVSHASEFLSWKYGDNPYPHETDLYLALMGDRVIGMRGVCGARWETSGQDSKGIPVGVDTGLDSEHRDGILYRELNEFAFADLASRGHEAIISLSPTAEMYLAAVLTMGWKGVGSLGYLIKSDRPGGPVTVNPSRGDGMTARLKGAVAKIPPLMSVVRWHRTRAPFGRFDRHSKSLSGSRHLMISDTPKHELMADLVKRKPSDGRIRHVRDITYLTWRYRNPAHSYRFLYWGREPLEGYLVLMRGSSVGPVSILDWEATDPEVAAALLQPVIDSAAFSHLRIWGRSLSASALDLLRTLGFIEPAVTEESRFADRFMVRALDVGPNDRALELGDRRLDKASDWDLRMVYSSAF